MSEVGTGDIRDLRGRIAWWARCHNFQAANYLTGWWLRDMSALAHAEVDWESGQWAVTPPTAALLPGSGGTAVLVGSRRVGFRERLEKTELAMHIVESSAVADKPIPVPSPIFVQADSMDELADRLAAAEITYAGEAALNIARSLRPIALGALAGPPAWNAPVEHLRPSGDDVRFDSGLPSGNGLCRTSVLGRRSYLYRLGNEWHHTDHATGILLDRSARGVNLMRWRGERGGDGRSIGTLFVDQGSPLPPLQTRALVLCSGLCVHFSERAQTAIYRNVPKDVAQLVAESVQQTLTVIR